MAFEVGQRVGDYEILALLGSGGMGHVYRARNIISDRMEAMKVLLPDLSAERDLAVRFISEIRTLAGFDHPNIALLHTAFQADNQLIMIMEYVEGYTLEQRAKQSALTVTEIADYISQALSALSYAHERNVIHRDIKPANLMVTPHGVVKLMDFGIAKSNVDINLTRPGTTIGSFYYMSPEQVRGSTVDARSDLYSIGIVLYELLAGRRPFESDSTYGVLNQQLNDLPQPPIEINPSLSPQLNAIILAALAKDPADRFQNAEAFRNALKSFRSGASGAGASNMEAQGASLPLAASAAPSSAPQSAATFKVASAQQPSARAPQSDASKTPRNNKPLWIATGALAAMLAIVGLAIGVPRLLKTHASEAAGANSQPSTNVAALGAGTAADGSASPTTSTPGAAPPTTTVPGQTPSPVLSPLDAAPAMPSNPHPAANAGTGARGTNGGGPNSGSAPRQQASSRLPFKGTGSQGGSQALSTMQPHAADQPNAGSSQAEVEQFQERMIQLGAKADAVDRAISQLRRQQEADGLGLRNDMEAADGRLRSYMQAANQDMQSARISSAGRNMDKAEAEIQILDKFLGR